MLCLCYVYGNNFFTSFMGYVTVYGKGLWTNHYDKHDSSLNGADGILEHVSFPSTDECTDVFMTSPACMKVGPDLPRPLLLA